VDTLVLNQKDALGNTALIVVIDTFTRWVELYQISKLDEEQATQKLLEHFGRFGAPMEIVTDGGAQFVNGMVKTLCKNFGTKFRKTPIAYSHEHNAKVERANKEILRHLRAFIMDERVMQDWSRAIPMVQYILNHTPHSRRGYSPAELLFGPALNMNRYVVEQYPNLMEPENDLLWWEEQNGIHKEILKHARRIQEETDNQHLNSQSKEATIYQVGDYVLAEYPQTFGDARGRPPNKLQTIRKGPLRVINVEDDGYELLDLVTKKSEIIHVSRIVPFNYDPEKVDPENIALRDKGVFEIEAVVDAITDISLKKDQWSFKVKWDGYDSTFDSWIDWKDCKKNSIIHEYLRRNKLGSKIPAAYQTLADKHSKGKKGRKRHHTTDDTVETILPKSVENQKKDRLTRRENRTEILKGSQGKEYESTQV